MTSALRSSEHDRRLIRDLACQVAEIAALPVQAAKCAMWVKLNRLEPVRPMVWINDIIMKDISTCRRDPRRLWEWCTLAMDVAEQYA
jgi:hypothetical protein